MNGTLFRLPRGFAVVIALVSPYWLSAAAADLDVHAVQPASGNAAGPIERNPTATGTFVEGVRYVSHRMPVQGGSMEFAAIRPPAVRSTPTAPVARGTGANSWQLQATLPGAVVKDLAFPSATVGYAAAELGQVWKTTDGGTTWTRILNLGYPYYWYGVHAFSEQDIVISGFDNAAFKGLLRRSHDGGATWSDDIVVSDHGWLYRVRYIDESIGLAVDGVNSTAPNMAHNTTNGGIAATDWTSVIPDPDGGWFGNFSLLPSGRAHMSGTTYCNSTDVGATWACRPAIDPIFDGPMYFFDDANGWVGSGTIMPDVEGWVHHTTDGGATWSDRALLPWPIRDFLFLNATTGWAVGGNIYTNVGGIYFSKDGGETWAPDLDSGGHEMGACARVAQRIWCAGYSNSFNSKVYVLDFDDVIYANGFD